MTSSCLRQGPNGVLRNLSAATIHICPLSHEEERALGNPQLPKQHRA